MLVGTPVRMALQRPYWRVWPAGYNTQFADHRAAGRLSAPPRETLPLLPPQPIEHFSVCPISARADTTQSVLNRNIEERKASAPGVPRKRVLGVKVLQRTGPCRPGDKLARSITSPSQAPAFWLQVSVGPSPECVFITAGPSTKLFPSYTKCQCHCDLLANMLCPTNPGLAHPPPCSPPACLTQNCPALGMLPPRRRQGFAIHSALPTSMRSTSTELYLVRLAAHERDPS